jgi:DNA-binding HxlR family transcriptional regulator
MTGYGQFCPVAKATEIVGDKWTMLILRELLMGTTRFNDFQRSMSRISPTVLNKRLKMLESSGVIIRKRQSGLKGHDYLLTSMGRELEPVVEHLAIWGMRWARGQMSDDELDVELLMWDLRRRIDSKSLPDGETVLCFTFTDLEKYRNWWLVFDGDDVDLCTEDPGKDVDLYVSSDLRTMIEVWEGDRSLKTSIDDERITVIGSRHLIQSIHGWFGLCAFADVRPADRAES